MKLSKAEVNHLRLLLAWMRCSEGVFQSPEEIKATWRDLNEHGIVPSDNAETRERLMKSYNLSADVPKYIRHALKMLTAALREHEEKMAHGPVLSVAEVPATTRRRPVPRRLLTELK